MTKAKLRAKQIECITRSRDRNRPEKVFILSDVGVGFVGLHHPEVEIVLHGSDQEKADIARNAIAPLVGYFDRG